MNKVKEGWVRFALTLPIPIEEDGKKRKQHYIEVEIFKAKHLKELPEQFQNSEIDLTAINIIPLLVVLSGLPEESIKEIRVKDLSAISEKADDFL